MNRKYLLIRIADTGKYIKSFMAERGVPPALVCKQDGGTTGMEYQLRRSSMQYVSTYQSPVGALTLASDGESLTGLWIEGQKYYGDTLPTAAEKRDDIPVFDETKNWLSRYFEGKKPAISELPLSPVGGEFRQSVWNILRSIPYGEVTTYGAIAEKVAAGSGKSTMSAQAVGGAVGHNPISIIIPCHRVVGSNGSLTGYAGGISTKIKLLELEGADMIALFVPGKGTAL
jgi:methylated-DNA-[protein]-cysteine S-methyltransferase